MDLGAIEELIRHDISFSHSLLTYLTSRFSTGLPGLRSVRWGLRLLGSDGIRKWVWMQVRSSPPQNRPPVLVARGMRGRFCEVIAQCGEISLAGESDPFLIGMFSLLRMRFCKGRCREFFEEYFHNISRNLRNALLGTGGETDPFSLVLRIVKSYETGDFHAVDAIARAIGLSADTLSSCYLESLWWVENVFSPDEQTWRGAQISAPVSFHRNREHLAI